MKFQQRLIIGDRPSHVPATADIFNAPRPLFGSLDNEMPLTWKSDFITGIFYAAVTQEDDLRSNWMEQNRRLAATRLVFITEEQAKDMVRPELFGRYPSLTEDLFNEVWKNMFDEYHRNSEVEIV